jgi:hypothetical protein
MPKNWAQSHTLKNVPKPMPIAARLHSVGRVLIAAGNQRERIERKSINGGQKKGLSGCPEKPFESSCIWGRNPRSVPRPAGQRQCILMRVKYKNNEVIKAWRSAR